MPPGQQNYPAYSQYGVFWLYNWFQPENSNMNIYFLMNGNIFNYSLASEPYSWGCSGCSALAIPPAPPANTSTRGEPIFVQSYINAYNTAFNQPINRQEALYHYQLFTWSNVSSSFVPGTFGSREEYNIIIHPIQDDLSVYAETPYLFVSTGSGEGPGFMYLDWIIVTYGVPYVISLS